MLCQVKDFSQPCELLGVLSAVYNVLHRLQLLVRSPIALYADHLAYQPTQINEYLNYLPFEILAHCNLICLTDNND
jgi:hypothetical protein